MKREMDLNKEMSRKIEDLRPRLHMLRSQKMELNGRVIELQSTIASLKDDIKIVESNLHMKNGENKMLRDKITEILNEKDAEIEQLKLINAEQLQHQRVKVQSLETQVSNSTTAPDKVVELEVKRVDESKGLETSSVTRNVEHVDGKGQVGDVSRGGMKLEVPYDSKQDVGFKGDGKRSAMSRAKGKKWRVTARNKRLRNNGLAMGTKKVSKGELGERFVAQSKDTLDHEKNDHEYEIHGTGLDAGENALENTTGTEVRTGDGRVRARDNQVIENLTTDDIESRIKDDHLELKGNVGNSDVSENVEFKDVPDESMSNRTVDSNNDDDATDHGVNEHALQDSKANESGDGSSESEIEEEDQDDTQETNAEEAEEEEEENRDRLESDDPETDIA